MFDYRTLSNHNLIDLVRLSLTDFWFDFAPLFTPARCQPSFTYFIKIVVSIFCFSLFKTMKNRATKQERQHAYNLLAEPTYPPPPPTSPNRHTGKTVKVVAIYTYIHTYIHTSGKTFSFHLNNVFKKPSGKTVT